MTRPRGFLTLLFILATVAPAAADSFPVILKGTVVTEDGDPPPVTVSLERICSDDFGSAPGPLTNKKGEYLWRMDVNPQLTRSCILRASHAGYVSTTINISALDGVQTIVNLPPIVVTSQSSDPYAILVTDNVPPKAKKAWTAAVKAINSGSREEAKTQLESVVATAPKFAVGWHALGVMDERLEHPSDARAAYQHAIEADPKLLPPYMTLIRLCIKTKDWACASQTGDALVQADSKHTFQDVYFHRAVARFELKDLNGAESDVQEAIKLDTKHKLPRSEYVLGRILQAKGNTEEARQHIAKFLELAPTAADAGLVKTYMDKLGNAGDSSAPPLDPL